MKPETIQLLNDINRAFYNSESAAGFSDTREHAWPGWSRVLERVRSAGRETRVLDVGCGNGRFAQFLSRAYASNGYERNPTAALQYWGVDNSQPLLQRARARMDAMEGVDFIHSDVARLANEPAFLPGPFSLIVLFGVMHHVASYHARRALLASLIQRLSPGGILAATFWRFGQFQRFQRKVIDWKTYNQRVTSPVDIGDLETGDVLLRWGTGDDSYRYCHFASDREIEALIVSVGVPCIDRFISDGEDNALNDYAILSNG
jgi:SAM-dependent methyltransferase